MFDMGVEAMDLPLEEKMKYEQGDSGESAGYEVPFALHPLKIEDVNDYFVDSKS